MTITSFTPVDGIIGGLLIGIATAAWLWLYGRVTGISGIVGGLLLKSPVGDRGWRAWYLAGLIGGALLYLWLAGHGLPGTHFRVDLQTTWPVLVIAGFLVGFGTRLGHGCTSGHGICGISRLSRRSLVATATFMAFGFATVFVVRHVFGG